MNKNQIVEMVIDRFGAEGEGVGRYEGMAVFVPFALPGERVRARIEKVKPRYAFGKLLNILDKSPARVSPPCPHFYQCGGCTCQHMNYETTLEFKRVKVKDCLERVGGFKDFYVPPVTGAEKPWKYRNKTALPIGDGPTAGFYAPRSHRVIDLSACPVARPPAMEAVRALKEWMKEFDIPAYDEETGTGLVRHLIARVSQSGECLLALVVNADQIPREDELIARMRASVPKLTSLCLCENTRRDNVILDGRCVPLFGGGRMTETLLGFSYAVSPLSFFQVNPAQAEKLYGIALDFADVRKSDLALDLYCGAGAITLPLAARCGRAIGVESVQPAVADARENAARNHVENAEFICEQAEIALPRLAKDGIKPAAIILDPPRKGAEEAVLRAAAEISPRVIVYVSCDPATLARDAKLLSSLGYRPREIKCVDMFCWTGKIESVMRFTKEEDENV